MEEEEEDATVKVTWNYEVKSNLHILDWKNLVDSTRLRGTDSIEDLFILYHFPERITFIQYQCLNHMDY